MKKNRSIFVKWTLETSSNNLLSENAIKSILPRASHLLSSLNKLNKATIVIIAIILTLSFVIYSSLKCSATSELYKTHLEQYQYLISGVYLKEFVPALSLFFFHTGVIYLNLYCIFRIFVSDWKVMRFSNYLGTELVTSTKGVSISISKESAVRIGYQFLFILVFVMIPLLVNVGYVTVTEILDDIQNACIQLVLLLFNASVRIFLPIFVPYLFGLKDLKSYSTLYVGTLAGLVSFLDIAVPFIATLFKSDLCIQQYLPTSTPNEISIEYSYPVCTDFYSDGTCYEPSRTLLSTSVDFVPIPVYSGQCRNAVLRNYLPPVIYSCAFQAFVNPSIYFLCTYSISDLSDVIKVFGYSFEAKDIVLPDMIYSIILIWGDFLLWSDQSLYCLFYRSEYMFPNLFAAY